MHRRGAKGISSGNSLFKSQPWPGVSMRFERVCRSWVYSVKFLGNSSFHPWFRVPKSQLPWYGRETFPFEKVPWFGYSLLHLTSAASKQKPSLKTIFPNTLYILVRCGYPIWLSPDERGDKGESLPPHAAVSSPRRACAPLCLYRYACGKSRYGPRHRTVSLPALGPDAAGLSPRPGLRMRTR